MENTQVTIKQSDTKNLLTIAIMSVCLTACVGESDRVDIASTQENPQEISKDQDDDSAEQVTKPIVTEVLVSANEIEVSQSFQVTLKGSHLKQITDVTISDCTNIKEISQTDTQSVYACTAPSDPKKSAITVTLANGESFTSEVLVQFVSAKSETPPPKKEPVPEKEPTLPVPEKEPTPPVPEKEPTPPVPEKEPTLPVPVNLKIVKVIATGITTCGNYYIDKYIETTNNLSSNVLDCQDTTDTQGHPIPQKQDGHVQAGEPMSYSKLEQNGETCIKDNVTGLIWEKKTADGSTRDKDHMYTWYNPDASTNGGFEGVKDGGKNSKNWCKDSICDTHAYIQALNSANYCGYSNWRLPTKQELDNIVDFGRAQPAINPIFSNTKYRNAGGDGSSYWTSSEIANTEGKSIWTVNFKDGTLNPHNNHKGNLRLTRAVRSQ